MTSSRAGLPVHLASAVATPETRRADPPLPQHDSALAAACDVSLVARQNTATQYIRVLHTGRARGCILAKWRQLADFVHESLAGMFNEVRVPAVWTVAHRGQPPLPCPRPTRSQADSVDQRDGRRLVTS